MGVAWANHDADNDVSLDHGGEVVEFDLGAGPLGLEFSEAAQRGFLDNRTDCGHLAFEKGARKSLSLLLVDGVVRVQSQHVVVGERALGLSLDIMLGVDRVLSDEELIELPGLGEAYGRHTKQEKADFVREDIVRVYNFDDLDEDDGSIETLANKAKAAIIGTEGMLVNYMKCCRPVPGDAITAYVSQGKGLNVHRQECKNIKGWESERSKYFVVKWDDNPEKEYIAGLRVEIINHQGTLAKLTSVVASTNANIVEIATDEKESNLYIIDLGITVKDRVHVADVMRKIRVMPDVQRVYRKK